MLKITEKRILSFFPMIYMVLLFLLPTIIMVIIAFSVPGDYGGVQPLITHDANKTLLNLSLESFQFALNNHFIWQLFFRSIAFSLITTFCCLFLGYPLAMMIAKSNNKYRDLLLLLVIVPFWSCFLIRIYAWMIILGPDSGVSHVINYVIQFFGYPAVNLLYSSVAVIICLIYINLPFMILPIYANLEKHDHALIEASRDLGASRFKSFYKITIPLSMPGILAGSALVFVPSMGMFVVPELVGNKCSLMIGNLIKQQFLQAMNWPLGSATSIIMTISVLSISLFLGLLASRMGGLKYASK